MPAQDRVTRIARGETPLEAWGQQFPARLNRKEWDAFEAAKRSGYAVTSLRRANLRNSWWEWCQAHSHPFVIIVRGSTRHVWVEANALPAGVSISSSTIAQLKLIMRRHPRRGARGVCGPLHLFRTLLTLDEAEEIATELLAALSEDLSPRQETPARSRCVILDFDAARRATERLCRATAP